MKRYNAKETRRENTDVWEERDPLTSDNDRYCETNFESNNDN